MPYVVTFREALVELPARNNDTPLFGVTVTFALADVLEIIITVEPLAKATFAVVGIYSVVAVACV